MDDVELVELVARAMRNEFVAEYDPDAALYDDCHEAVKTAWRFKAQAAITALRAAGWQKVEEDECVVSREPTGAMMVAGVKANDAYATEIAPCSAFRSHDAYRAMIAARPK